MRDALGVLLVAAGLAWTVLTRDKLGLAIAFGGATLLAYGVLKPHGPAPADGKEPPISEHPHQEVGRRRSVKLIRADRERRLTGYEAFQ